jgi:hypothetical protein
LLLEGAGASTPLALLSVDGSENGEKEKGTLGTGPTPAAANPKA